MYEKRGYQTIRHEKWTVEMVMVWEIGKWNRKGLVFAAVCMMMLLAGCGSRAQDKADIVGAQANDRSVTFNENVSVDVET